MRVVKSEGAVRRCPRVRQRTLEFGVSLIEVLIAIVIASIGLLALAGVNASSIRYAKMSQYRGTATMLANDIAERMRANSLGFASYGLGSDFSTQVSVPSAPSPLCNSYGGVTCTAAQVAAVDLQSWRVRLRSQLPEGSAYITILNAQVAADLWIVWRDPAVATDDLDRTNGECPNGLSVGSDYSVRCSYFRINL